MTWNPISPLKEKGRGRCFWKNWWQSSDPETISKCLEMSEMTRQKYCSWYITTLVAKYSYTSNIYCNIVYIMSLNFGGTYDMVPTVLCTISYEYLVLCIVD